MRYRVWREQNDFQSHHDLQSETYSISFLEQQAKMDEYGGKEMTTDFIQVIFPLAWIAFFGSVSPSAVLLAYLNLSVQLRADAWRLVAVYRRPFPLRTNGIGIWNDILDLLNYLSIFNLLGLLTLHVRSIDKLFPSFMFQHVGELSHAHRLAAYFTLQNIAVLCKVTFSKFVPDVGPKTQLSKSRQELQRTRLFEFSKAEYDEDVTARGTGDYMFARFEQHPGLSPGDERFIDPPLQSWGCDFNPMPFLRNLIQRSRALSSDPRETRPPF